MQLVCQTTSINEQPPSNLDWSNLSNSPYTLLNHLWDKERICQSISITRQGSKSGTKPADISSYKNSRSVILSAYMWGGRWGQVMNSNQKISSLKFVEKMPSAQLKKSRAEPGLAWPVTTRPAIFSAKLQAWATWPDLIVKYDAPPTDGLRWPWREPDLQRFRATPRPGQDRRPGLTAATDRRRATASWFPTSWAAPRRDDLQRATKWATSRLQPAKWAATPGACNPSKKKTTTESWVFFYLIFLNQIITGSEHFFHYNSV